MVCWEDLFGIQLNLWGIEISTDLLLFLHLLSIQFNLWGIEIVYHPHVSIRFLIFNLTYEVLKFNNGRSYDGLSNSI